MGLILFFTLMAPLPIMLALSTKKLFEGPRTAMAKGREAPARFRGALNAGFDD